jgi:hypothetical protein
MAIVMSLAGLALATITPLTPTQCVLLIGVPRVVYRTLAEAPMRSSLKSNSPLSHSIMNLIRSVMGSVSFHGIGDLLGPHARRKLLPMFPVCSVTYVAGLHRRCPLPAGR